MIRKHHVKFQNDRMNSVGGVTQTRCGTDIYVKCSKSRKGNNSFKNTRIKKSKWYAYLQMIRKHHVKFQNDWRNGVGGVTQTRRGADIYVKMF